MRMQVWPNLRLRVHVFLMQTSRLYRPCGASASRFGLRGQSPHWVSGSRVSSRSATGSAMIKRSGLSGPRRRRNTLPGPVMSRHHRRPPLAKLRLPVPNPPRLCRPLHPIDSLDLLRIPLLHSRRLHECLLKPATPPHRIAAIRRRTSEPSRGRRPGSSGPRRERNRRLRPLMSQDHWHLLTRQRQLAMLSALGQRVPLRSITTAHLLLTLHH